MADEGEIPGIDLGDLPELLDAVARDADPDDGLPLRKKSGEWCSHKMAYLNQEQRELRCRGCNALLDPFDFLTRLANDAEHWVRERRAVEARARRAKGELEELLRLERNARSRLKRLRDKP